MLLAFVLLAWSVFEPSLPGLAQRPAGRLRGPLLQANSYRHYFADFVEQEHDFLGDQPQSLDWEWFTANIPLIDVPDEALEETYYFRWYSFQKHIRGTPRGFVIDEFLDDVSWAGKWNTIDAASDMHLREARWLRDQQYAEEYAHFWFTPDGEPRRYSFPVADSVYSVYLADGNTEFAIALLPALVRNYAAWEATHQDANGLFWQLDDRDGMEESIGGSGYRPTINSYMYGEALALSRLAALSGNQALSQQYAEKAKVLRDQIETKLWNAPAGFYETLPRGENTRPVNVRELIGYLPWYFEAPDSTHVIAWKQLKDPSGFAGRYGPTTAERRSPRFRFPDPHECLWNGPSWPFATTQTLTALANLLNGPHQAVISDRDYFNLLSTYAHSQRIRTPKGNLIPWIDEDLDPDTGEWIARSILASRHQQPANRGRYYNHSGFADLIVTGLIGVRPSSSGALTIHPLVPPGTWPYFAIDALPYHGHLLTIFYDRTGGRYHYPAGVHVFCDGAEVGFSRKLKPFTVRIP